MFNIEDQGYILFSMRLNVYVKTNFLQPVLCEILCEIFNHIHNVILNFDLEGQGHILITLFDSYAHQNNSVFNSL